MQTKTLVNTFTHRITTLSTLQLVCYALPSGLSTFFPHELYSNRVDNSERIRTLAHDNGARVDCSWPCCHFPRGSNCPGDRKTLAAYLGIRFWRRIARFVEANIRPYAISRVLTNRYMHRKDYFRYISHVATAVMGFAVSTLIELLLVGLIMIYFIVKGATFSWALFFFFH